MFATTGRRVLSWVLSITRKRLLTREFPSHGRAGWRNIWKCVCVATGVALPVGLHLTSRVSFPRLPLTPVMANSQRQDREEITSRADKLYESNKMKEGLLYLSQYESMDEVEVLWRLARLCYKLGRYQTQDLEEKKKLAQQGWGYIEKCISLGGDRHNACQRWAGILLSWSSEFEGTKKKIEKSFEIRDHFLRAVECDEKDATSLHLLGQWCYSVVSVPWYQRQVASLLFATPPQSTFQEALSYFEKAEKVDPGFYMVNWLWIGKCHIALGDKQEARKWLEKTADFVATLEEELEARKEAETLLKTILK